MILTNPNIYVSGFGPVLTQLVKENCDIYYAVGIGDSNWDLESDKGLGNKNRSRTTLFNETFRKQVNASLEVDYLGEGDIPSEEPTNKLQLRIKFQVDEAVGDLREFGIFVALESEDISAKDSGIMIIHEIHDKMVKTDSEVIERYVNLILMN